MIITTKILHAVMPKASTAWLIPLTDALHEFGITTRGRVAAWLGNVAHETAELVRLEESLDYSWQRLIKVFPKYFDEDSARDYERQPARIGSRVYAGRMGNGPEESGDGYKYRGRGTPHLTGKDMYERCGRALKADLVESPELLVDDYYLAARAGAWFFEFKGLQLMADKGMFLEVCQQWNGSRAPNGMKERERYYRAALEVLGA